MLRILSIVASSSVIVGAAVSTASAQPSGRFYVGAAIGAFRVSADEVDGTSAAGSVLAGFAVTPWLNIEIDMVLPTSAFTQTYGGDALSVSFAQTGSSREETERFGVWPRYDKRRDVGASISSVALFHRPSGTVRPAFIVGVTSQSVRDQTVYTPVRVGSGLDPNHPYASPRIEMASQNEGALTFGGNVAIVLSRHLSIVPDIRYDYGSIGDEINNALRTSIRMLWRF
jgi:hypothetical protein